MEDTTNSNLQQRAIRLIDYLLELARIRSKIVRDIDDYQCIRDYNSILWLADIPKERECCYLRIWEENGEHDKEVWIEIRKSNESELDRDKIPKTCRPWINEDVIEDDAEFPELLSSIEIEEKLPNPDDPEGKKVAVTRKLSINDFPDIKKEWDEYLLTHWVEWADLHKRWRGVQEAYSRLFRIRQLQLKLGEKYELVLGIGFISWLTPTGQRTRRHLITAKAELAFEARLGKFTVKPSTEGANLTVEFDMLDVEDQPFKARQKAQEELQSAHDDPWDRSCVDQILAGLANSFAEHGQGAYHPEFLDKPGHNKVQRKPIVDFAPALFLRERSERGLEVTLRAMRDHVLSNSKIPPVFRDLCEGRPDGEEEIDLPELLPSDGTIYFPKPYNKEQRQIIEKVQSSFGVLVQGPPGTGKSHTIANLICHLLATGQRVLVTAKTPRALRVLHKLLPDQVKPLCISLLGDGIEEQKSLGVSINSILREQDRWREDAAHSKIRDLQSKLMQLKAENATIESRIRSIRKADSEEQAFLGGKYIGTTAQIAKQLQRESEHYIWLQDSIRYDQEILVSREDLIRLRKLLIEIPPDQQKELDLVIPDPQSDLPPPNIFANLQKKGSEARNRYKESEHLLKSSSGIALERATSESIQNIVLAVSRLVNAKESIEKRPMPWIGNAIYEILAYNDTPWRDRLRKLNEKLEGLKERTENIGAQYVEIPFSSDRNRLLEDARSLKAHFDQGGKSHRFLIFKPQIVRENKHIIENVKVNGRPSNNSKSLETLIEYISIGQDIDYCWNLWLGKAERKSGSFSLQVSELEELQEALTRVVSMYDLLNNARKIFQEIQGLAEPRWYDNQDVKQLTHICEITMAKREYDQVADQWRHNRSRIQKYAEIIMVHPMVKDALIAIDKGKPDEYAAILDKLQQKRERSSKLKWAKETLSRAAKNAPIFAKELADTLANEEWDIRLDQILRAWDWKRANSWLQDFLNKDDLTGLKCKIEQLDRDISECMAELSATLAWKFCFQRLTDSHCRHLSGWQLAIKRLGKGTGKHAPVYRRDAQDNLNKCKDAIPAWVMPLHRVYDTVQTQPGAFDFIIVDEASQCGFEAYPLTFLAKKLLIVGDNKQISPDAVGVELAPIFQKVKDEYLFDLEYKDLFYVDTSLFDQGVSRFGKNRVTLCEHFRCMPEIIQFSNDNWYHSSLEPLRQYPPDRLEPLLLKHVAAGIREGDGSRAINRAEAEAIVEEIIACCENGQYIDALGRKMTFGVITLQGNSQGPLIENMLVERLGAKEMEERRLICGDPYSFQGDERDVIFLSMVAAPNMTIGTLTKESDQQRFNVACSRARDQVWLFHSATRNDLSKSCLRWKLLEYFEDPRSRITKVLGADAEELRKLASTANRMPGSQPKPYGSWFEVDVAVAIASKGYRVIPQYEIAGRRIDLIVEGEKTRLAVECYGDKWHGQERYDSDMDRQRMLERCGLVFHIIRECAYYAFQEETLEQLWSALERNGVHVMTSRSAGVTPSLGKALVRSIDQQGGQESAMPVSSARLIAKAKDIQAALDLRPAHLRRFIMETLKTRPNWTCVKEALPGWVLKYLEINTRGNPRHKFERKVFSELRRMVDDSIVEIYKAKNERVRLLAKDFGESLFSES